MNKLKFTVLACLFLVVLVSYGQQKNLKGDFKIIGYAAGYENYDFSKIDAEKLTHINFAFANIIDGKATFELETDAEKIQTLMDLERVNPDLKILFSVGGWAWSNEFSNVATYSDLRNKFVASCIVLLEEYGFDGVDLDWEYPGQRAEDNPFRPSDKDKFTLLLAEIRKALDVKEKENNAHYLLTIASGSDQAYIDQTDLGKAHHYLDFINIMCYDFYQGWFYQTGHHANLHPSKREQYLGNSAEEAIQRHLIAGVPPNKIVMGIPFYGRQWQKVSVGKDGLYEPAAEGGMIVPYWKIKEKLDNPNYKKLYDDSAKATYLWNSAERVFVSFDTPKDIKLKTEYIKEKGLAGAMFWEYSLDKDQELLNTLYEGLK